MREKMQTAPLADLANFAMGQSPDSAHVNGDERGLPFLQGCAEFGARHPSARVHCFPPLRIAKAGSTLISVRAPVGTMNRADQDYCIGRGLAAILAKAGVADDVFLASAIEQNLSYLHRRSQGSTFLAIGSADLKSMPVAAPDLPQQQRIAEILSTVDEAIEQTEALIAKTQQIKAGLMHDLFTRGVTADGQLRPPREGAPQLYKESPLGWIPKEWAIRPLRECLFENPTNGIYKPADQIGRGTLLVGQTSFTEERSVDFSLARRAVIGGDELRRYSLAQGNILLSRVFATLEGVGQPTLVPALPEPAVYESNMMRLRVDTSTIKPRLLFEWLRAHRARRLIVAGANASNQSSINQQVLNPLPVLVSQSHEQERMLSLIEGDDERAACERESLIKLRGVKIALMQDMLTGRVPVAVETKPTTGKVAANV